ncbi:MAG: hypothetical protein NTW85_07850 [Methylococcales bacterium]|jgi:Zinc binding domain|nr:hypothetical protein [Methylococcales bacterium]
MSSCCSNHATKIITGICPQCGESCKSVEHKTLYHQVKFPENQKISLDKYYFCSSEKCPVGYFSSTGHAISKQQLRTYQEIEDDKLCYCFDINADHYLSALTANNAETLKNFVIQKTKSGDCACDIKNPSGQCCLAKFKALERLASSSLVN